MRGETDRPKLENWMQALGKILKAPARIYLVGGATAVYEGWRTSTIDIDLKAEPEPTGFYEAIAETKEGHDLNIELASPEQFIPELPGWRERSKFLVRYGVLDFYAYDFYAQALAKIERGHTRDLTDVRAMRKAGHIDDARLLELFESIRLNLIRYPAIDPETFSRAVYTTVSEQP